MDGVFQSTKLCRVRDKVWYVRNWRELSDYKAALRQSPGRKRTARNQTPDLRRLAINISCLRPNLCPAQSIDCAKRSTMRERELRFPADKKEDPVRSAA